MILCSLCIVITMIMFGCDEEEEDPNLGVDDKKESEREGVIVGHGHVEAVIR